MMGAEDESGDRIEWTEYTTAVSSFTQCLSTSGCYYAFINVLNQCISLQFSGCSLWLTFCFSFLSPPLSFLWMPDRAPVSLERCCRPLFYFSPTCTCFISMLAYTEMNWGFLVVVFFLGWTGTGLLSLEALLMLEQELFQTDWGLLIQSRLRQHCNSAIHKQSVMEVELGLLTTLKGLVIWGTFISSRIWDQWRFRSRL